MSASENELFAACPVSHILPRDLGAGRVILCSGEVESDLLAAFRGRTGPVLDCGRYRCYAFWRYADFTLILAGIGTGSLEPLLWEILRPGIVKKIVLIGTAGAVTAKAPALGTALPISQAWSCGGGIDGELG
ncbi:MAG TPA: hypothetical protein PKI32_09165, partial [Opitutales bacterium]|nr:hypothetical protein [Opitutales bacterium]